MATWASLNFEFVGIFDIFKLEIAKKIQIQSLQNCCNERFSSSLNTQLFFIIRGQRMSRTILNFWGIYPQYSTTKLAQKMHLVQKPFHKQIQYKIPHKKCKIRSIKSIFLRKIFVEFNLGLNWHVVISYSDKF